MSPDVGEAIEINSYEFRDSNDTVHVYLHATGAIEQKDVDVLTETDSLEISAPGNEKWIFQLYEHVYTDQIEMKVEINEKRDKTTIELCLHKQQPHTIWPQLCSQSNPKTPQRNNEDTDMIDEQINFSHPYQISIKNLKTEFIETNDNKVKSQIYIQKVYDCQVQFTETNFTATFYTNDEQFIQNHSISPKMPIKLFVRVKERIKPNQCSHIVTPSYIEIILVKENEYSGNRWNRLEPNEFSEHRPLLQPTSPSSHPLLTTNTHSLLPNPTRAIALPSSQSIDRMSDKHSSGYQKDMSHSPSTTTSIGYTGIYNPANSCFMNAALQCLSNTSELRDYFLKSYYVVELNRTNPLGMKGEMAEEFGSTIKSLWCGKYNYVIANKLRDYAAKRHQEFVGNGQHDAQEFLNILLDAIHEDLNRVITKPLVPSIENTDRPDDIVADECWRGYLSRNDSLIVQLFTGQFKSKTKCPQCHKESVTFDPFTSLSVPLPKRIAVDTIVTFRNDEKPPTKYRIVISAEGSIAELKSLLSSKCGLSTAKMLAYKIPGNRSIDYLKDEDRVSSSNYSWSNFDTTYITEILTSAECNNEPIIHLTFFQRIFKLPDYLSSCAYCQAPPNPHSIQKYCNKCYRASYCDEQCLKFHASDHHYNCEFRSSDNYENVGPPFIISLPQSKLTCENVFEQISIYAKRTVDIHIERSKQAQPSFGINNNFNQDYGGDIIDDDEEDSFSDIENVDWAHIKRTLSSCDSWSICRIGDYFVKTNKNKRRHNQQNDRKEKILKNLPTNTNEDDESMIITSDSGSNSSTDDFDMLDDIYGNQPLFRIMPQTTDHSNNNNNIQPIVEPGDDGDSILRCHTTFSIDWFTDNKMEAPLRVTSSKNRSGINGLIEDDSVSNSSSGDQDITLQQCLQLFIEPEVLGPDDKWYCPHCKEHIQAEKKMSIWRLPPILIIHLKRFKYNHSSSFGYMSSSREKIDSTVKFPTHDLDMTPYCSSIAEEDKFKTRYDLYGIINHRGTAWFGHYTAYARLLANNDSAKTEIGWRNFDDERVSPLANVKDLVRSDAYVLFYRHRNLPVNFVIKDQLERLLSNHQLCENNSDTIN